MLPGEIEPFADHHIANLKAIVAVLHPSHLSRDSVTITPDVIEDWCKRVDAAAGALERFKICMADEVKQKDRYRKYAKENGYQYS